MLCTIDDVCFVYLKMSEELSLLCVIVDEVCEEEVTNPKKKECGQRIGIKIEHSFHIQIY